jgi:hypothetical protein
MEALRRSLARVLILCDAALLGPRWDAYMALHRLPRALRLCEQRPHAVLEALSQEGHP